MFKLFAKNKKGFTLVEVIVVLVILAILAAIMVPSMTGWIDKAKDQSILVEGRTCLLAAQTVISEMAATTSTSPSGEVTLTAAQVTEFNKLAGAGMAAKCTITVADWQVTKLVYVNGKTATYSAGSWSVA